MTNAAIKAELEAMIGQRSQSAQREQQMTNVSASPKKEQAEEQALTMSPVKSKRAWANAELESIVQRSHLAQKEQMMKPPVSPTPPPKMEEPEEQTPPPLSPLKAMLSWGKKQEEEKPEVEEPEEVEEEEEEHEGVYKKQRMRPPQPMPGMLNAEMAEAAAIKYQKSQARIQQACAKLDNPPPPPPEPEKASCGACAIL
jgi:hypothetical protein